MDFNTKIFLKINGLYGKNRWLDSFGRAGAEWVIFGMAGWFVATAYLSTLSLRRFFLIMAALVLILLVGWGLDLLLGFFARENRPYLASDHVHSMFRAFFGWKSFPSDHTMAAFTIFLLALIFHLPFAWPLLLLALWVGWGRVFAGVHYPLDIAGGISVAVLLSLVAAQFIKIL